jgi:hypothetical protein
LESAARALRAVLYSPVWIDEHGSPIMTTPGMADQLDLAEQLSSRTRGQFRAHVCQGAGMAGLPGRQRSIAGRFSNGTQATPFRSRSTSRKRRSCWRATGIGSGASAGDLGASSHWRVSDSASRHSARRGDGGNRAPDQFDQPARTDRIRKDIPSNWLAGRHLQRKCLRRLGRVVRAHLEILGGHRARFAHAGQQHSRRSEVALARSRTPTSIAM